VPGLTRAAAIERLSTDWDEAMRLFGRFDDGAFARRGTIGGGEWSAKDLLGHLAFWEEICLIQLDAWWKDELLRMDERFAPGGVDAVNAWNERRKLRWSAARVRSDADTTHHRLLAAIEGLTDAEWRSIVPLPIAQRMTLGTRLGRLAGGKSGPFHHVRDHLAELDAATATGYVSM
jgi:hypothetical protein